MSEHWFWTCREKFQQIAGLVITFAGMGWVRDIGAGAIELAGASAPKFLTAGAQLNLWDTCKK